MYYIVTLKIITSPQRGENGTNRGEKGVKTRKKHKKSRLSNDSRLSFVFRLGQEGEQLLTGRNAQFMIQVAGVGFYRVFGQAEGGRNFLASFIGQNHL